MTAIVRVVEGLGWPGDRVATGELVVLVGLVRWVVGSGCCVVATSRSQGVCSHVQVPLNLLHNSTSALQEQL